MRSTCGLCSSQGFFYVAAVTGCIFGILNMSFTEPPPLDSGVDLTASRASKFGPTYVVEPKGKHQATIVWLHGLGDDGSSWLQHLEPLPLPNIKWIFPTSPARPFTLFGGLPTTTYQTIHIEERREYYLLMVTDIFTACKVSLCATSKNLVSWMLGFDVVEMSEDATQDVEGMDASAAYVLSLLSIEPQEIKLGVGGFSMGAATAIYSASCFVRGKLGNHTGSPTHLDAVVGLSGWLPCANDLSNEVEGNEVEGRAALPILLCHGRGDDVVNFRYGERSAEKLTLVGFEDLTFKSFNSLGHNVIPEEMNEVSLWLTSKLELEG